MALVAAAAFAGTAAAAMYLDGTYHLKKDVQRILATKRGEAVYKRAVCEKRQSLYYLFEAAVKRHGNGECIWSREGCYTWIQAFDRINKYGQWYLAQGVRPHDYVAIYMQNSPDFVFAWLGLWSIGAAPAMINYHLVGKALVHCLRVSEAKLLLVDDDQDLLVRVEDVALTLEIELGLRFVVLSGQTKAEIAQTISHRPGDAYREVVQGDWPIALIFTSGTTGMPKGCPFTVSRQWKGGNFVAAGVSLDPDTDRWYNCMPMYHGTGGIGAITQLMNGIPLCIGKRFSTSRFWSEVRDSRATWITYVGETARYLLAAPPSSRDKDHHLRGMYGNGLRPDVWIKFCDRFGISEVLEFFSSSEGVFSVAVSSKGDYLVGAVGHHGVLARALMKNTFVPVRVDQAHGNIARDPETGFACRTQYQTGGEIIVNVPSEAVFGGYFNNTEATKMKFERNVFKKGDLWYRSGDALRRTGDGRWYFLDRLGDTFRWKGENVSTAEVSEVIGKFPGVVEANVYGVLLPKHDGRAGCAALYINPNERSSFDYTGLLSHARKYLPRYAVPIFLRIVQEMTPIHNNKQNKVPLREEGVDPAKVEPGDQIRWIVGNTYQPFTADHWDGLHDGKSRL